ncbi:MAG: DUF362 domain-containing protein [Candidatus Thorarchaeota archaeon]|jgi:hypothetical protein
MTHKGDPKCPRQELKTKHLLTKLGIIAVFSAMWFALRTGMKPSRAMYPCQQAALVNIQTFKTMVIGSIPVIACFRSTLDYAKPVLLLSVIVVGSFFITFNPVIFDFEALQFNQDDYTRVPISLTSHTANASIGTSDVFFVQNATGLEGDSNAAVTALLDMMSAEGLQFYKTASTTDGLIGSNDVVIIKMNGQWEYRGGTNTDLIKSIIHAIIGHPEVFTGEIIVADNGQSGGDLDRRWSNAYFRNQSAQDVVDSFAPTYDVSTVLWDLLRSRTVAEYDEEDLSDGYVRSSTWNNDTQMYVSYPKFQSSTSGAYISFKNGVWNNKTGYDSDRLKILNMPVLKTHQRLAVTASVKNYMGVPQGYVIPSVDEYIPHEHFSIALGGMGTLMAETRVPTLNILDMIWINANPIEASPQRGPWSVYSAASFTDIIGASMDPVALDYWSAKNVLVPTAQHFGYVNCSSLDPDYEPIVEHSNIWVNPPFFAQEDSFHNYLKRSMNKLNDAGFQATMDPNEMNVFVTTLVDRPIIPITPNTTTPTGDLGPPDQLDLLPVTFLVISAGVVVIIAMAIVRRRTR